MRCGKGVIGGRGPVDKAEQGTPFQKAITVEETAGLGLAAITLWG